LITENKQLIILFFFCLIFWYLGFPFIGFTLFFLGFQLHEEIIDEVFIDHLYESEVDDPDYFYCRAALHGRICKLQRLRILHRTNKVYKRSIYLKYGKKMSKQINADKVCELNSLSYSFNKRLFCYLTDQIYLIDNTQ
jgi:hypothetical protein